MITKPQAHLRPNVFLVDTTATHALDHLLSLRGIHSSFFGDDLSENIIDFSGHVSSITTDVEVGLLLEQVVDQFAILLDMMLHVNLLGTFSGECIEDDQFVAKSLLIFLYQ